MNSYHVLELAGEGSFGRVYKGRKRYTGQVVALKFMPKVGRSERELRSLKREIEIMRDLKHPNIVQLYDSFETETEVVVVTEFAEGQLFQILEDDGHLPESQVREIACQLVSALYYLHFHRILHRDMKPQNILLGKSGKVKLCDFGFARAMSVSTLVLTSIKGTPLYMSPELVEEKPYDHTADLWSLGCILYELHTGAPPFYTNSIFQLVQLIVKGPVKWPDSMSPMCMNFLKGLLTKDPQKRLSWPDLLHHPFVADGVLVLTDTTSYIPLTVTPSPDTLALKLQQVAEKTVPIFGEGRLLRKVREQTEAGNRVKSATSDSAKKKKDGVRNERVTSGMVPAPPRVKPPSFDVSVTSSHSSKTAASQSLDAKTQACMRSRTRGQISRDYDQEFPSVEVGPRLVRRCSEDIDSEDYWQKLAHESDPNRQPQELLNHSAIIPQLKSKLQAFKAQLTSGDVNVAWQIQLPLRVLYNMILTSDLEKLSQIHRGLGLPHILFDLIHDTVENFTFNRHPESVPALPEMIVVLVMYWEKHCDWVEAEQRLEEFTKPFITILSQQDLIHLGPLAASVLSLFIKHNTDVQIHMDDLSSLLKTILLDSFESQCSVPFGWGLCDGLLSLLLHTLSERDSVSVSSGLDPALFLDLFKRISTSLEATKPDTDFCSANGLYSFLSAALLVFTKDPYSCIPLFSDCQSKSVFTLGRLLGTDCPHLFAGGSPGRREADLSHDSLSVLSCHLLCFPFALDLPSHIMSTIIQLYDSCGIVTSLLQVIQLLPAPLLELPLSLLSRLLLCDPKRFVSRLKDNRCGFLVSPGQLTAIKSQAPLTRTASSLLSDFLLVKELWDSAVELLNLLSQVARFSPPHACFQLHLETSVLHRALAHSYYQIRAATCRLLGNLDPFSPTTPQTLKPDIFKSMMDCLCDSYMPVRRVACRAVGNWLGFIAAKEELKQGRSSGKDRGTTGWGAEERQNKHAFPHSMAVGDLATIAELEMDKEEMSRWLEEARRTVALLAPLLSDCDALTRRHCCAALGNLVYVGGAVSLLLKEDVTNLLLKGACADPNNAVRQAAVGTLYLYSQQDAIHQVLITVNAITKLRQASQHASPQCDYQRLIAQLTER
ncbi:serine/threonine-protein kinase 36 isoform X2 [Notolabrus celidotus]|uniref:serine/threonine-protein kinase 36 isoform X2 n=1 Tax=Notolabrus celidotus TaxID=1203425 RepID=UPI00148F78F9|nr:serine/threonine-protein kinase 36 isoform X2 [Notolabrus celidotus]